MEGEKRRWGWRDEATGGMTALSGSGMCRILSGDRTGERYSIAFAALGKRAGPAKLICLSTAARPPCRAAVAVGRGPGSFWTVSLNAMSLPVME